MSKIASTKKHRILEDCIKIDSTNIFRKEYMKQNSKKKICYHWKMR